MTFQQLNYIVEIAKYSSINKAAQSLFVSQSSVSNAIKELEKELGVQLLTRNNRGVEFTSEGKEFLGYASMLVEQKLQIQNLYSDSNKKTSNYISISSQRYPFAEEAFVNLMNTSNYKRFRYHLNITDMDSVIENVYMGASDIGIIFSSKTTEKILDRAFEMKELEFKEIKSVNPCVFLRYNHPLASKKTIKPMEMFKYPYITYENKRGTASEFSEEYYIYTMCASDRVIYVNDRASCYNFLRHTDSVTSGSGLLVENISDPQIVSIPLECEDKMKIGFIKSKNKTLSEFTCEFLKLLKISIENSVIYTEKIRNKYL